jgi:hypothetical protein
MCCGRQDSASTTTSAATEVPSCGRRRHFSGRPSICISVTSSRPPGSIGSGLIAEAQPLRPSRWIRSSADQLCRPGPDPVVTEINYFNPSFRYPRNLRLALGTDVALPWNMVGTVDLLYIKGIDQFDITDINSRHRPPPRQAKADGCSMAPSIPPTRRHSQPAEPPLRYSGRDPQLER